MFENAPLLKKWLFGTVIFVILLVVGLWAYRYLSTGLISVKSTNSGDYVSIEGILKQGKNSLVSKQARQQLTVRVKPGSYQLSVYDKHGFSGSSRVVSIRARQHLSYTLSVSSAAAYPEPVYGNSVTGLVADQSRLTFVDTADSSLRTISTDDVLSPISDLIIKSARWSKPGLGAAQSNSNGLYVVRDGSLTPVKLPFRVSLEQTVNYDVSSREELYVSEGGNVYVSGYNDAFKKLFSAPDRFRLIAAGPGKVALAGGGVTAQADEGGSARQTKTDQSYIYVVSDNGQTTKTSWPATSISWSPNGTYLLTAGPGGNVIFDGSLHKKYTISVNNADLVTWLTDDELLYSIDSQLWLYSIKSQQAEKITALPRGDSITAIYPSADSHYAYFTSDNGEKRQLFRVPLNGQAVNTALTALSVFMPETLGGCSLNYINYVKPTIIVNYPAGTTADKCSTVVQAEAAYYGVGSDGLVYQFSPSQGE